MRALAQLRELLPRCWPETLMAAFVDQNRSERRVFAMQCPLAGCGEVSMATTDRSDTLTVAGHRVRRVAAHDLDQRRRLTAAKFGAWHSTKDGLPSSK
jgi:hypothetical protein